MSKLPDDFVEEFTEWNPMKEDYHNSDFNLYDDGPGAGLDQALQPAELAKGKPSKLRPYLVFKNLPKNMTEKSLRLLCERHGTVEETFVYQRTSSIFVYFYNISDMDAAYRAIQQNDYDFQVSIGHKINREKQDIDSEISRSWGIPISQHSASDIELENRNIVISGKKPPRPKLTNGSEHEKPNLNGSDCAIGENDPLQQCVKETDCHELERAGIQIAKETSNGDREYQYSTGSVYYNMPAKTKSFVEAKHQSSEGTYKAEKEKYVKQNAAQQKPNIIMRCVVCNAAADQGCYRCGAEMYIYCGLKCQNVDWEHHRLICGKPKSFKNKSAEQPTTSTSLNSSSSSLEKTPNKNSNSKTPSLASSDNDTPTKCTFPIPQMPPSNSLVALTSVFSPHMVFIRSKECKENAKFFEIVNKLQAASKTLQPLKHLPREGQAVVAKLDYNGEYKRALVLKVNDAKGIRINFLDYGNIEIVQMSQLYKIPDEFMLLPRFASPVLLKGVPKCYMTNEIRSFLYTYLTDINLIVKYSNDNESLTAENIYQVDLYDAATKQHLNKTIATIAQPHEPKDVNEIVTMDKLKRMPMPVGDDIELIVLDNSEIQTGCISCSTAVYHREIECFQQDVQNYAKNLPPQWYAPRQNELCVAKYSVDNLWYRGCCLEKVGDGKPLILFIDFGNFECVPVKDIRPYPPEFHWPIFTLDFGIAGLPADENLSDKLVKRLEELFPVGKTLHTDKVEHMQDDFYVLHMNEILKTLENENLLAAN